MNNIKKTALGAMVAVLTIGFSAFTTVKRGNTARYYKTSTVHGVNDPRAYQYFSEDRCESGGSLCSVIWDIGSVTPPTIDGTFLPLSGCFIVSGTEDDGHFE